MRILHQRLAAVVADLRHGEMICVCDAGAGTGSKAIVPLADDVEKIDLGIATNVPTSLEVISAINAVGDVEAAIVADTTPKANPDLYAYLIETYQAEAVHVIPYLPDWYELRNRVRLVVQTGDYGLAANVILVGGFPSPNIPLPWLSSDAWYQELLHRRSGTPEA